ncbi:MAG: hypothetical protein PHC34_13365 [Candidatus Gastranaerophilales bacterium]|nr:hypothetical protein [Candidatus Gastranaerophilales bacterium]
MEVKNSISFKGVPTNTIALETQKILQKHGIYDFGENAIKDLTSNSAEKVDEFVQQVTKAKGKINEIEIISKAKEELEKSLKGPIEGMKEVVKELRKNAPEKPSKAMEWISKPLRWIAPKLEGIVKDGKKLTSVVLYGNALKELAGTTIYTIQALTNEDLPPDKRKFIGLYDLGVGLISSTCSIIFAWKFPKLGDDVAKKLLKKYENTTHYPGYKKALTGLGFIAGTAIQTILCKRMIAPAIATPIAGKWRDQMEAKEAAKQGQPVDYSIPPENDIVLSSSNIKNQTSVDKTVAPKPVRNIFAMYKKAAEEPKQTA